MHPTSYHRPSSVEQAITLFSEREEATYISGGHTLLPAMKQGLANPSDLIDVCTIPGLDFIEQEGQHLIIGATTSHVKVAQSDLVKKWIPALAGLAGTIGDRQVRQRGTIGGSIANNDPAADYPASLLGLGATIVTNVRELPADDYFVSLFETALEPGELVLKIRFPIPIEAAYAKFRSAAARYPQAGVFIARTKDGVRVAVTGAGASGVFRASEVEDALNACFSLEAIEGIRMDPDMLMEDLYATSEYRANLIMVMARQAMQHMGLAQSFK